MLIKKTESRYKNKLTAESCFHLHKILDSVTQNFGQCPMEALKFPNLPTTTSSTINTAAPHHNHSSLSPLLPQ